MHPAKSVILFTTLSGAGYGLITLLIAAQLIGLIPAEPVLGFLGFGLGFAMITVGLLSSTFHLGHPERAWRALTQWRSSWLSREGVMALLTFLPTGAYGIWWCFSGGAEFAMRPIVGLLGIICCLGTIYCTAMIYASLKTIRAWNNPWVPAGYLILAIMSGALLLSAMLHLLDMAVPVLDGLAAVMLALAFSLKVGYWRFLAAPQGAEASTIGSATGLGAFGNVSLLEAPHTENNYLLREMGFSIARKHSGKLRRIAMASGFMVPLLMVVLAQLAPAFSIGFVLLAVLSAAVGLAAERWLFFAEAKHTVSLYYGAETA